MSETVAYNQVVEQALETAGVDTGRVKDDNLARDLAEAQDSSMKFNSNVYTTNGEYVIPDSQEVQKNAEEEVDRLMRDKLADQAVKAAGIDMDSIVADKSEAAGMNEVQFGSPDYMQRAESMNEVVEQLPETAVAKDITTQVNNDIDAIANNK